MNQTIIQSDRAFIIVLAALVMYIFVAASLSFYVWYQRRQSRRDDQRLQDYRNQNAKLHREVDRLRDLNTMESMRLTQVEEQLATIRRWWLTMDVADPTKQNVDTQVAPPKLHVPEADFEPEVEENFSSEEPVAPVAAPIAAPEPTEVTATTRDYELEAPDDLTRVWGIGAGNQQRLQENGVFYFEQIAAWSDSDVDRFNELLTFKGRIEREGWVAQAQQLCQQKNASRAA